MLGFLFVQDVQKLFSHFFEKQDIFWKPLF
jgi:hypothetical protein